MSEEIIDLVDDYLIQHKYMECFIDEEDDKKQYLAIQGLLDLYQKEKEKNKELEKQMGKDLDVVYLQGVYNEKDKWKDKIKAKIEELEKQKDNEYLTNYYGTKEPQRLKEFQYKIQVLQELLKEGEENV